MEKKDFIKKNFIGIVCAVMIVSMFLPFVKYSAQEVVGYEKIGSESVIATINGFDFMGKGGIIGVVVPLCAIVVLAYNYIPFNKKDKGLLPVIASAIGLFTLNISPSVITDKVVGDMFYEGNIIYEYGRKYEVYTNRSICFWLMFIGFAIFLFKYGSQLIFANKNNANIFQSKS